VKLKNSQEEQLLYQANLLQHISDAVIATDLELKITSWNQAAEAIYGWRSVEVIGRWTEEVLQTQYQDAAQREQILGELQVQEGWEGEVL
jgi:PAS domain S-box-containing protein